jgi:hypothetical protein
LRRFINRHVIDVQALTLLRNYQLLDDIYLLLARDDNDAQRNIDVATALWETLCALPVLKTLLLVLVWVPLHPQPFQLPSLTKVTLYDVRGAMPEFVAPVLQSLTIHQWWLDTPLPPDSLRTSLIHCNALTELHLVTTPSTSIVPLIHLLPPELMSVIPVIVVGWRTRSCTES